MEARLQFHGATQEVTGSMHLLETNGHRIALDCGLFHGRRAEANEKNRSFPGEPKSIDAVVLSHAHIDHCGKLPRLVREGFDGPIYATPPTCHLVEILLADSAYIQAEDVAYWNKKRVKKGDKPIEVLYEPEDVEATVRLLKPVRLDTSFEVRPGVMARFHEAGHMLGSAGVGLTLKIKGAERRITFTGDLGRPNLAILRDPAPLPACDYLISESTYGSRTTPQAQGMKEQLAEVVNATVERGGKLIIPAFAVGRTQNIVYFYNQAVHEGLIKQRVPLIVDSPLASKATEIFRRHPEVFDEEASDFKRDAGHLFRGEWCEYTRSVDDSIALHRRKEPMIIVSASGMCEAGRILHHLKNNLTNRRNSVLIVGYQGAHTLGRRLVERVKEVRIFGETYEVHAQVRTLNGFSAHANAEELQAWTAPLAHDTRQAFLVHGEMSEAEVLADAMRSDGFRDVRIPKRGESFPIK